MDHGDHPLKLIAITAEDFYSLEQRSAAFASWLDANNSPAELMAVLEPALRRRPHAQPPEREVLRRLLLSFSWCQPGLSVICLWRMAPFGCGMHSLLTTRSSICPWASLLISTGCKPCPWEHRFDCCGLSESPGSVS